MSAALPELIEALLSPGAYPHEAEGVELIQTHISYVLLAGPYAYKIKKPIELHFLDYSTLERRRLMCEEEVRLNRRLCPDVYLGVVPIARAAGGYRVGGAGAPLEYAVQMRRMPADRMMPALLARGAVTGDDVRAIAHVIAAFHRASATDRHISSFGEIDVLRLNWDENFDQTRPFVGRTLTREQSDEIRAYVGRFLHENAALIAQRAAQGRTRDCHGDLRADAIVIGQDGEICVMDCIEFNDRIRYGDVAGDIGFLAMDLDVRGRPELADELISAYLGEAGDETLPCVLDFYRCYRAYVRGKVESMQLDEPEVPEDQRQAARIRAARYFDLACSYAATAYALVAVMMVGLSGSGKSYLAGGLAGRLGAALLSSDATRRELLGMPAGAHEHVEYGRGVYAEAARERVYDEMHARAAAHLRQGRSVIMDATYASRRDRDAARRVADAAGVRLIAVEVAAEEATVRSHLARRAGEPQSASDARWEIYLAQRERFEPPDEVAPRARLRVDGGRPLRQNIERVLDAVRRLSA